MRINDIARILTEKGHEVSVLTGLPNYPEGKVLAGYKGRNYKNHRKGNAFRGGCDALKARRPRQ